MKAEVNLSPSIKLEIDEQDEMMTLHKAIALSSPPVKCSLCQEADIRIETNKDKEGNIYINAVCLGCYAKAKLGRYKTGGYFWHYNFEKYEKKSGATTTSETTPSAAQDDVVPF